jgi:hypothetical protein
VSGSITVEQKRDVADAMVQWAEDEFRRIEREQTIPPA